MKCNLWLIRYSYLKEKEKKWEKGRDRWNRSLMQLEKMKKRDEEKK
jgi:hypothetical protein